MQKRNRHLRQFEQSAQHLGHRHGVEGGERIVNKGAGFLKDGDLVNVSTAVNGS